MNELSQDRPGVLSGWRVAGWGALAALIALPAIAMQFTAEVAWSGRDFLAMAVMLLAVGIAMEVIRLVARGRSARLALMAAAVGMFLLVWAELAVGLFG